ncbi:unnamed protein product [Diamesa tonsa]
MFHVSEQRRRQIDTLKIFNDNVFEIQENDKYGIKFKASKHKMTLLIELDSEFPQSTPKLYVTVKNKNQVILIHPYIEDGFIKNAPGILNYSPNSDLGRICQAVIREFEKNPPQLSLVPRITSVIPELNVLDTDQLQLLLEDEQYFCDFVEELSQMKDLNSALDDLILSTEAIAIENLSKEEDLVELKSNVEKLSQEFSQLGERYEQNNIKYQRKSEEFSPSHIKELLAIGVSTMENSLEDGVENFLSGKESLPEFLDKFMEAKKIIATRKYKEERLSYQLSQLSASDKFQ